MIKLNQRSASRFSDSVRSSPYHSRPPQSKSALAPVAPMDYKMLKQKTRMSGVSVESLDMALRTYENSTGPGQYESRSLLGGDKLLYSKTINMPKYTVNLPRSKPVVDPETRDMIPSPHKTPAGADYSIPTDNINYKREGVTHKWSEKKFFTPTNMPKIKAQLDIQYTGLDGVSPRADNVNASLRGSRLSTYVGGSQTATYRQVDIGKGQRFDFTKSSTDGKTDAKYEFEKF